MSSIVVVRGLGDRKGQDIVEALLSSVSAKLERGRVEMDKHNQPEQAITLEIVYRKGVRRGQLVEVVDAAQGQVWRGKITSIAHRLTETSHTTELTIAKPNKDF